MNSSVSGEDFVNRVLIVEDEPDISDYLYETLSLSDYEVCQAYDGLEGLDKVKKFKPHLVLLDIMMPKLNGIEVCRRIRAMEDQQSLRVIFITAKGSLEEKLEGFEAGANDFIVKPFSSSELLARIEAHLRIDNLTRDLEISEKRYRQLIENSPDGIMLFTDNSKLLFANSRVSALVPLTGMRLDPGMTIKALSANSALFNEIGKLVAKVYETRLNISRTVVTGFQRNFPSVLEIRGIPTEMPDARRPIVQLVMRDVTEKFNMEKILARTEKINALGILTAGIAHEINNPLTGISNAVQILQKSDSDQGKRKEIIDLILSNIGRITRIIDDLRIFSRQERFESNQFTLTEVIEETIKLLRYQRGNDQVEVKFLHEQAECILTGSKNKFQQVLVNLLINASQAISGAGQITVELNVLDKPSATAVLKISDTGCGIPDDQLEQIFDPFYTTKRDWHGTGLGLAVSYRIIQLFKGSISVASQLGHGTTFTITLPLDKA
ncbi:MAG TPA: response regulator [Candidatus Rifleibacterium sp.]|nr:response regulator [Candidatus Rifleibacterium sp.]HPT48124.1 response regulator [Candidatus Rifleibacterium sp.]